jgi:peroxiredoxin
VPELNRLERDEVQVLVVNRGNLADTKAWAAKTGARCPVLAQEGRDLARRYEVFATPFAFLVSEQGVIVSKGIVGNPRHIGFVLSGAHEVREEKSSVEREALA